MNANTARSLVIVIFGLSLIVSEPSGQRARTVSDIADPNADSAHQRLEFR
jgi:hypothetical protein